MPSGTRLPDKRLHAESVDSGMSRRQGQQTRPALDPHLTQFELDRQARIAENHARLRVIGVLGAVQELQQGLQQVRQAAARQRRAAAPISQRGTPARTRAHPSVQYIASPGSQQLQPSSSGSSWVSSDADQELWPRWLVQL